MDDGVEGSATTAGIATVAATGTAMYAATATSTSNGRSELCSDRL